MEARISTILRLWRYNYALRLSVIGALTFLPLVGLILFSGWKYRAARIAHKQLAASVADARKTSVLSADGTSVEIPVWRVIPYEWGITVNDLSEALKAFPQATVFHVDWDLFDPEGTDEFTVTYNRKTHTLRWWEYDHFVEGHSQQWTCNVYSQVTDAKIICLGDQYPVKLDVDFPDLKNENCPCNHTERMVVQAR